MGSIPAGRANKQRLRLSRSSAFVFWAANGLPFAHHARYSQFDPPNPARSADANSVRFLTVTKKHDYGNASHWEEVLGREFAKESDFAHNVAGCTFEDRPVRSRIVELAKSSGFIEREIPLRRDLPDGPRG